MGMLKGGCLEMYGEYAGITTAEGGLVPFPGAITHPYLLTPKLQPQAIKPQTPNTRYLYIFLVYPSKELQNP